MIATHILFSTFAGIVTFMAAAGVLSQLAPNPRGRAVDMCVLTLWASAVLGIISGWEICARAFS